MALPALQNRNTVVTPQVSLDPLKDHPDARGHDRPQKEKQTEELEAPELFS